MRILIVEEALRLGNGHWPRYVADLAAGFRAEGDFVDVLGHRDANDKVKSVVPNVVTWLSRDCRADARSQGLIGGIRHNLCLKRELGAWLKGREPYDWILSLSSRPKHLLAFAMLSRAVYCARSRFLLLFVISPGQQDEAGKFRLSASNLFAKFCFALLRPAVCRGQVVIAAETQGMQAEIERFSDLRTLLFPHPVEAAQAPEEKAEHPRDSAEPKGKTNVGPKEGNRSEAEQKLKAEMLKKDGTTEGAAHRTTGRQDDGQQHVTTNYTNFHERGRQGDAQGTCAGDSEPDSLTSKLADSPVSESLIRSAAGPASSPATSHSLLATAPKALALDSPSKPVVVLAPGLARYEKGSDIFQEAIKLILSNEVASGEWRVTSAQNQSAAGLSEPVTNYSLPVTAPVVPLLDPRRSTLDSSQTAPAVARSVKFVMQWPEDFDLPDGRRCAPDPDLLKDERVKFSKDLLTGEAYWDFLQQADVIVLPYRSGSYRARVSRVAIEAAMLGKPMVYTKGTWISEVVAMGGAGVAIAEETPQSLAEAIQMAIGDLDTLQSEAERGVARVRNFYSVSSFHHLLVEVGENKKSNIAE